MWCLIAAPAFRQAERTPALEARLDRRLLALAWTSLLLALLSGIGWLIVVGSQMSGMPLAAVVQQGVVGVVLTQTQFGKVWLVRGALVIVLAACLLVRIRSWKQIVRWIGLAVCAALVVSLAWAGHGAATENVPGDFLHLPADLLHLLATGVWLGTLVPLALLLAEMLRDASPAGLTISRAACLRFSMLGITCVGTLVVTGIVNTWFLSGSIPALVGTLYGQLLLVKVAVFVAMIAVANANRSRLVPVLAHAASEVSGRLNTVRTLSRNVFTEASLGIVVLSIVGIIGILPPGLHTEPRWPFPFRLDFGDVAAGAQKVLDVAAILFVLCLAAGVIAAEKRRYRAAAVSLAGLVLCGGVAASAMRPGIVPAYPTTFYAPTQQYAAPSVARGAPLYAANCAVCHGTEGRGDGPLAKSLPIPPADLTEPHLFAHSVGDIFWWVSYGRAQGVMPGFAGKLTPDQRWDLINFLLARTAGILTDATGSQVATTAAPPLPDFAFEQDGAQNTLSQTLKNGPVLLVLFAPPAPRARLGQLARLGPRLGTAGLHVIAVGLGKSTVEAPFVVDASDDVRATLALFRSSKDGGETELMLDRNGSVRARWTEGGAGKLADGPTLLADAVRISKIPVAAANHAGHAQ